MFKRDKKVTGENKNKTKQNTINQNKENLMMTDTDTYKRFAIVAADDEAIKALKTAR